MTTPSFAELDCTLSTAVLPAVIDKTLAIDWDIEKIPKSGAESLGLDKRSHLAKCKIVQQYQTHQQHAAQALKEEATLCSPTAASRAASALPPAEVKHHPHPLNAHWSQDRIARFDRLSTPTALRLRQVTQRREKPRAPNAAPATAYSAHTAVAAAKMYASSHRGWQSRKTPWNRPEKRRLRQQQQLEEHTVRRDGGGELRYPAEWEPRVEKLSAEFEDSYHRSEVVEALLYLDGHAGKVARLLRGGIHESAFKDPSLAAGDDGGSIGDSGAEHSPGVEVQV